MFYYFFHIGILHCDEKQLIVSVIRVSEDVLCSWWDIIQALHYTVMFHTKKLVLLVYLISSSDWPHNHSVKPNEKKSMIWEQPNSLITWYLWASLYSVGRSRPSFLHLCVHFPCFCFSHFSSSFHIPFLSSGVAVVRKEDERLNNSLSLHPSTPPQCCLRFDIPTSVFPDDCTICLSPHLYSPVPSPPPLLTPPPSPFVHCFYCSLQLLKYKERVGKLNKGAEMYSERDNLINQGYLATVNNVAPLASQCPRCD